MKHTLVATAENSPSMLNRVVSLFRQRGFAIDSLAIGRTHEAHISRITMVVDGSKTSYSNLAEEDSDRTLSSFGITVHMLSQGDRFDLSTRTPYAHPADSMDETEDEERGTGTNEERGGGE